MKKAKVFIDLNLNQTLLITEALFTQCSLVRQGILRKITISNCHDNENRRLSLVRKRSGKMLHAVNLPSRCGGVLRQCLRCL